jgi:hypothetical protein
MRPTGIRLDFDIVVEDYYWLPMLNGKFLYIPLVYVAQLT